jgi:hypothetical protein
MAAEASAGELELLDAVNLMERGDYSGAVRRIITAIEAELESVLRDELRKQYPEAEVCARLHASQNDFPGRLRQYQKLSGRKMHNADREDLETTRALRHGIVHEGKRISYAQRGRAQRAVDTGRWIFNWLENQSKRADRREKQLALRSLRRHFSIYEAEITSDGVVVHKPPLVEEESS